MRNVSVHEVSAAPRGGHHPYPAEISCSRDALRRPATLSWGTDYQAEYAYDNSSRLASVTAFGRSAAYTRMAGANRLTSTVFRNGETAVHTANRSYDGFNRLTGISGYGYTLNSRDERTRLTLTDGSAWDYTYDGIGQVTGGIKTDAAEVPLASHAYTYDQIGNRLTSSSGLTVIQYTANLLNQYTAAGAETPTYDDDGNMLTNGDWSYSWNTENRLIAAESATAKLEFAYDYLGRRTTKKVYAKSGDAWTLQTTKHFIYDGFKQIAELTDNAVTMYTVWQPATGGDPDVPLWTKRGTEVLTCVADGNKNIRELKNDSGTTVGAYDYDPFGNVTATGTTTPWQFSSEYRDEETGLVYYNYRYYDPRLGRWIKRDPIGESGGTNLYGMCNNTPACAIDFRGYECCIEWPEGVTYTGSNIIESFGYAIDSRTKIRYKTSHLITFISKEDLKFAAKILYAEATPRTNGKPTDEQYAIASVMFNRLGRWDGNNLLSNLNEVLNSKAFVSRDGTRLKSIASDEDVRNLSEIDCNDLKSAVQAIKTTFCDRSVKYKYNSFTQDNKPDRTKIGSHYFWVNANFSFYRNNEIISNLKFDSLESLNRLTRKEYTIQKGDTLSGLSMKWYGDPRGVILTTINPELDPKKLKIGDKIEYWDIDETF